MRTSAAIVAAVAFGGAAFLACSRPRSDAADAAASASAPSEPIPIGAGDLARAYKADAARADATYKGKRLRVSGVVRGATAGAALTIVLADETDASLSVDCALGDALAKQAPAFRPGLHLTLECACGGGGASGVVLDGCGFGAAASATSPGEARGPSAMAVCAKLETAGIAASCKQGTAGDSARFDIVALPGKGGLVVHLADATTYEKYVAGAAAQGPNSPLRPYHASSNARVVVHLATGVPSEVENKTKAVVDAL